jgi:hypothetical protein
MKAGKRSLQETGIAAARALLQDLVLEAEKEAEINEEDEAFLEAALVLVPKAENVAMIKAMAAAAVEKTCGMYKIALREETIEIGVESILTNL